MNQAMQLATVCARWNSERLAGLTIEGETFMHVAEVALGLTHEHHGSILSLLVDGRLGSGLALLRPCFESLVRGLWLLRGPDDSQRQHFEDGRDSKSIEKLLADLNRKPKSAEDAFLLKTWELSKQSLHQYTHTSYQLLMRRVNEDMLEGMPAYTEVADAIQFATGTAMLASVEIAKLGQDPALEQEALRFLGILYPPQKVDV